MPNTYLKKYAYQPAKIAATPHPDVGIVVVIPCHSEPDLVTSLKALQECDAPACAVEVITVINASEKSTKEVLEQNVKTYREAKAWAEQHNSDRIRFYFLEENSLPDKHAGVGLARKIGMDEAVARFEKLNRNGTIVCFDADATCSRNYLVEIERHFQQHATPGCSIYFEHPIEGKDHSPEIYQAITEYELFLHYYKWGLQFAGLPFAYHTVGSSMAVTSRAYQKQGGMNRRKAGEDFYFINKIIALGNFTELNTVKVIPSPRVSDRVPFGTGKAVGEWLNRNGEELQTYAPKTFADLQVLVDTVSNNLPLQDLPEPLQQFGATIELEENLKRIQQETNSYEVFAKRFFHWFDAFKVLKYVHFARDKYYQQVPITEAAAELLGMLGLPETEKGAKQLLGTFRQIQKNPGKLLPGFALESSQ